MQVHQYNVEDLFCNYVNRVLMNCPFLKLKVNDSAVIISFGEESCEYDASDTHQEFFERERYDIKTDIDTLEKLLTSVHSIPNTFCDKISKDELLLTHKKEITLACTETANLLKENMFIDFNDFMEYIKNNKRTILFVSKQRYFSMQTKRGDVTYLDAIPVNRYNYVEAFVVGSIGCQYTTYPYIPFDGNGSGIMKEEFVVTRQIVESLDEDTFNVYILKESEAEISYEIINKNL